MKRTYPCLILSLSAAIAAAGCPATTTSHERVERLTGTDGLEVSLSEAMPGDFDILAERAGTKVHLELRRGELRPADYTGAASTDGAYEGDALVADARGRVVLAELGGHAPVDASWDARLREVHGAINSELRRRELALAEELARFLGDAERLGPESRLLARGFAASVRATLDGFDDGPAVLADAEPSTDREAPSVPVESGRGDIGVVQGAAAATYVHQIYIRGARCCWADYNHSATRLRVFNSAGQLVSDTKTRNHGRWVDDATMLTAVGCPKSWSGRTNQMPFYQPYKPTDTFSSGQAGGCNSPYGPLAGQHVCNDDSLVQYSLVKTNPFLLPTYSTCSDATLRAYAPSCN